LVGVDVQDIRGKRQGYRGGDGIPVGDSGSRGKRGFCYLQFNMYREWPDLMRRNGRRRGIMVDKKMVWTIFAGVVIGQGHVDAKTR